MTDSTDITIFSCPSSSIPTLVTHSLTHSLTDCSEFSFRISTKPYQTYLTYLCDLLSWPTWSTWPPDIPTHLSHLPICPTHLTDLLSCPYNLLKQKDNHPEPTDNLPEPTDNLSHYRQYRHHLDQIFSCPSSSMPTLVTDSLTVLNHSITSSIPDYITSSIH